MGARAKQSVAGLLVLILAGPAIGDNAAGGWAYMRGVYSDDGKFAGQDFTMYTQAEDELGAAFRCNNGKLFAVISTRPLDMKYWMSLPPDNAETKRVSFSVDGGDEKDDQWVSIYHGRMYMATKISSTNTLFRTALTGGTVQFNKRKNQSIEIRLPPGDEYLFDSFLNKCELLERHDPITADQPKTQDTETVAGSRPEPPTA